MTLFSPTHMSRRILISLSLLLLPAVTHAQIKFSIASPLAFNSMEDFLVAILNILIIIATPIVVLAIIYAGFLYVTAQGNVEQTQKATRALTYSIIGGILIIGAVAASQIISNLVGAFAAP